MISTVIAKPTKYCNAHCLYCSSPQDNSSKWSLEQFEALFDSLLPRLSDRADFIWHGGEPMTMGVDFYYQAFEMAKKKLPGIRFSMQTNLLLYKSAVWKPLFDEVMEGRVSTSFDPDEQFRLIRQEGSTSEYTALFMKKLDALIEDGFMPLVIGTYSESSVASAFDFYNKSLERDVEGKSFDIRFNYRFPAGRATDNNALITPATYGQMLVDLFDRWIKDAPGFSITPLDQMLRAVTLNERSGEISRRCPWTSRCGGHFLGIEPDGSTYNCGEFADLNDPEYLFGNVFKSSAVELLESKAARNIQRRSYALPSDCSSCEFLNSCGGGCTRDSVLFGRGLGGKFYYCESWKMVFSRIKEAYLSGEADRIIKKIGI